MATRRVLVVAAAAAAALAFCFPRQVLAGIPKEPHFLGNPSNEQVE